MSWSISEVIGKPDKVKALVAPQFDQAAKNYEGRSEEKDVLAAKAAVLSWLDECNCSDAQGAKVAASGSRGEGWVTLNVSCTKISLVL